MAPRPAKSLYGEGAHPFQGMQDTVRATTHNEKKI